MSIYVAHMYSGQPIRGSDSQLCPKPPPKPSKVPLARLPRSPCLQPLVAPSNFSNTTRQTAIPLDTTCTEPSGCARRGAGNQDLHIINSVNDLETCREVNLVSQNHESTHDSQVNGVFRHFLNQKHIHTHLFYTHLHLHYRYSLLLSGLHVCPTMSALSDPFSKEKP